MVKIDHAKDLLFTALGWKRLKDSYMMDHETSPQERFKFIVETFGSNDDHAQRMYDYASRHWISFSTPILSFGRSRGLPISCYLPYLADTREGLVETSTECRRLSMSGGGIGLGIGLRSGSSKSAGVLPHLKTYDSDVLAYKQGSTRRGAIAAYLDISHPDIMQFLDMRKPTGGDPNQKCLNLHQGVNIPDSFMQIIEKCMTDPNERDDWPLVDPHSQEVIDVVSAKELWIKLLELRMQTGEPYLHFIDTSNSSLPPWLAARGMSIKQSNLCSEITLPTDADHTAVCCLSSFNLEYWDDWKEDENFISDCVEFLDNVLTYFNENAGSHLVRATRSAINSRDIGLGALGFHALLQRKGIPFESAIAVSLNKKIFGHIYDAGRKANRRLALERGEAPYAVGESVRLSHLFAVAPNASSSIIMGNTSPSIEPFRANAYRQDTLSGSMLAKNKWLELVLDTHSRNTDEVWSSIISNKGSVQHLSFLTDWEKDVFKTAFEIDQRWIIQHASDRQPFIDQAQSVNVFFAPDSHVTYVHQVHFDGWKKGLKTFYYCRSEKITQVDDVGRKAERIIIQPQTEEVCIACE